MAIGLGKIPAADPNAATAAEPSEADVLQSLEATVVDPPLRSFPASTAPRGMADEGTAELQELARRWELALRTQALASRVHVFALQPDGAYHPITAAGVDLERGLPYHGELARRVRDQPGPAFLFDLCLDPLTPEEHELVGALNCEIVGRTEGDDQPELLLFLAKERPGDDYTLEELEALDRCLRQSSAAVAAPAPTPALPRPDNALRVRGPASFLGAPAYQESERERLLRRKITHLRDIIAMSRSFDAAFGTSKLLDVLVLSVVSIARTETVLYFSEREGEFLLTHHRGLDREALAEMALRSDSTLVQAALQSDDVVHLDGHPRVAEEEQMWARQHGFAHALAFRVLDRPLGLLLLGASRAGEPDLEMLSTLLEEAALAYERAQLYETLQDRTLGVVRGLVRLIESCSGQDAGATERVVRYTQALAQEVQVPEESWRELAYGAVLRDIGMLRIDPEILRSSGQLTAEQWETVRRHPLEGAAIMRQMRFGEVAIEVVLHHHEAYNGEGYPSGLRGRAIPLGARLVAVAESYVKMTMDRPYRKALPQVEALESLAENWGLRYDPLIVDALVRVVNRELSMGLDEMELTRDLFGVP